MKNQNQNPGQNRYYLVKITVHPSEGFDYNSLHEEMKKASFGWDIELSIIPNNISNNHKSVLQTNIDNVLKLQCGLYVKQSKGGPGQIEEEVWGAIGSKTLGREVSVLVFQVCDFHAEHHNNHIHKSSTTKY